MRICIDGLSITHLQGTGYYSYAYGLLSDLFKIFPQPSYEFIWKKDRIIQEWKKYKNINYSFVELNRKNNDYLKLEEYLVNSNSDLYFSLNNGLSIPQNKVCKYMMTVHDLAPMSLNDPADEKYNNKFMQIFPQAIKKADTIIAVSEFIKKEIIKYFNLSDKKIKVVYPGCSYIFRPLDVLFAKVQLKQQYQIEGDYILYVGSIHPRKNLDTLIYAFHMLLKEYNDMKLVIVGNCGDKRTEYYLTLKKLIQSLEIQERVIFVGTVEHTDMPYFYNCANCTVNLSKYEGFPITAIEASACGSPIIYLRNSSFEELNLKAAVYLERLDTDVLKNTLLNIINSQYKRQIVNQSLSETASLYNWNTSAKKLVQIIETTVYEI